MANISASSEGIALAIINILFKVNFYFATPFSEPLKLHKGIIYNIPKISSDEHELVRIFYKDVHNSNKIARCEFKILNTDNSQCNSKVLIPYSHNYHSSVIENSNESVYCFIPKKSSILKDSVFFPGRDIVLLINALINRKRTIQEP